MRSLDPRDLVPHQLASQPQAKRAQAAVLRLDRA
jgi:hypothetical protein